jgi:hypothetical protein
VSGKKAIFCKKLIGNVFPAVLSLKVIKKKISDRCCKAVYIENGLGNGFLFEYTDELQGTLKETVVSTYKLFILTESFNALSCLFKDTGSGSGYIASIRV